eukprot:193048_1
MRVFPIPKPFRVFAFAFLPLPIAPFSYNVPPACNSSKFFLSNNNFSNISNTSNTSSNTISNTSTSPFKMSLGAWRCHGTTNREMVEKLAEARIIKSPQVKEAFLKVDRSDFSSSNMRNADNDE